jgi:CHAT domain-containing protein
MLRDGDAHRLLTFRELRGQDLSRLQLVTLATCRSAASALLPGGARICLPNAFLQAGARGVIASLWTVDDPLSVELMATLYRELRSKPAAAALAATQTHAIDHQLPIQEWAGLTFYGND